MYSELVSVNFPVASQKYISRVLFIIKYTLQETYISCRKMPQPFNKAELKSCLFVSGQT